MQSLCKRCYHGAFILLSVVLFYINIYIIYTIYNTQKNKNRQSVTGVTCVMFINQSESDVEKGGARDVNLATWRLSGESTNTGDTTVFKPENRL